MIEFYSTETWIALIAASIPGLLSLYLFFITDKHQLAFLLLLTSAFLLYLTAGILDPFLHNWDERHHALVAKHLVDNPLKPMLRLEPLLPYDPSAWCCNHVWVHKQPLFMWQIALFIKWFGAHELSVRLPAIIMSVIGVFLVYDIAQKWIKDTHVAYIAAFFTTFSFYQFGLVSGQLSLDQNDVAFAFFVSASIWAFTRLSTSKKAFYWAMLVGVFAGAAILNKWLTGLLVYGGWGLWLLLDKNYRLDKKQWFYLFVSFLVCLAVFLPWQIYITRAFPIESSISYAHNQKHITEVVEGHYGDKFFHIGKMYLMYGPPLVVFFGIGVFALFWKNMIPKKMSAAMLAMMLVVLAFFSVIVKTKMPSFTYPVNAIVWILIALGLVTSINLVAKKTIRNKLLLLATIIAGILVFRPWAIAANRSIANEDRNDKIYNTKVFKTLDQVINLDEYVIINCPTFEDLELMFYQDVNAYHWYPDEAQLDSLMLLDYQFAAFTDHGKYVLPDYIRNNPRISIIDIELK